MQTTETIAPSTRREVQEKTRSGHTRKKPFASLFKELRARRGKKATPPGPPIVVRKMDFDFDGVQKRWFAGLATPSHVINGLSILFPEGERFFIRAVKHYQGEITDPALK